MRPESRFASVSRHKAVGIAAAAFLAAMTALAFFFCALACPRVAYAATAVHAASPSPSSAVTAQAYSSAGRKYVFVGDSYACVRGVKNHEPWPELVVKKLGLTAGQYKMLRHSGYGFARRHKRFLTLIRRQKKDVKVTDVLIVGGAGNDRFAKDAAVRSYYKRTVAMLKRRYPNARIMHAIVNWRPKNEAYQTIIKQRIPLYRKLAKRCGVTYLVGCEKLLRKHPGWFQADKVHPNQKGANAMAKVLVRKIRKLEGS